MAMTMHPATFWQALTSIHAAISLAKHVSYLYAMSVLLTLMSYCLHVILLFYVKFLILVFINLNYAISVPNFFPDKV